jgi:hypothetical protein
MIWFVEEKPHKESPGFASQSSDMTDAFLAADQQGLTAATHESNGMTQLFTADQQGLTAARHESNGMTQPCAFKASSSDPDTLSCDKAMAGVD